jgi:hypothetical protein
MAAGDPLTSIHGHKVGLTSEGRLTAPGGVEMPTAAPFGVFGVDALPQIDFSGGAYSGAAIDYTPLSGGSNYGFPTLAAALSDQAFKNAVRAVLVRHGWWPTE